MRAFPPDLEQRAYDHARVRDWRAWGLLAADREAEAAAKAGEAPSHAAWPLRVLLFGFGALVAAAFAAIMLKDTSDRWVAAFTAFVLAALFVGAAEAIIRQLAVRRFGAEEALVAGACLLFAYGVERLLAAPARWHFSQAAFSFGLAAASAVAFARYGYRLCGLAALVAAGFMLGSCDWGERVTRVLLALLYGGLLAALMAAPEEPRRESDRLEIGRFFLALSVPLCLNVRLERVFSAYAGSPATSPFELATFAAIFLLPLAWLYWGARAASRPLIWAGTIGLVLAQCSVKPYLGLARHVWDPILLGVELVASALLLKRWLDAGPGGRRGAFSSEALRSPEPGGALGFLAAAAAGAVAAQHPPPAPAPDRVKGGGGTFGGGGASGGF